MNVILSIIKKELKLLVRDPAGLLMLFILPAVFILVLSIALQGTFLTAKKQEKIEIIAVNYDKGDNGKKLISALNDSGYFNVISEINKKKISLDDAKKEIQKGDHKIAVYIPEDTTEALDFKKESKIEIFVDPILSNDFAANITSSIQNFVYLTIINNISNITGNVFKEIKNERIDILQKEIALTKVKKEELAEELKEFQKMDMANDAKFLVEDITKKNIDELDKKINDLTKDLNKSVTKELSGDSEFSNLVKKNKGLLVTQIFYTESNQGESFPNSVQQNVPGWTIFALFWLVQILSLNILLERQSGAFKRIIMSPISTFTFFVGKTVPYFFINFLQAAVMFAIGKFILPLFGCPSLLLKNVPAMILITAGISFSSITLGLLFASCSNTLSVTASLSSVVLILMTIFGGIMVPKFIMPQAMQTISYFVPHGWALDAYQKILVKDGSIKDIMPNFLVLMMFSGFFLAISIVYFKRILKKD